MRALVMLVCLFPSLAFAGNLYRCVSGSGHVSYQSMSCPMDQRTDRRIKFVQEPVPLASTARRSERSAPGVAGTRRERIRGSSSSARAKTSACMQAKAQRELELQRLGLKRTFDDLSRIDASVRAVCNGF